MKTLTLRPAMPEDAAAISALIADLMPYMTLDADGAGAERFMESMAEPAIAGYLAQPRYQYLLGFIGTALAGAVAVRDRSHLFHLFVAREFHGCGLGRQLWLAARTSALVAGNTVGFTVNSSDYALPMYQRWGFLPTGPRVEEGGIAWVPMHLPPCA
jgi:ribosomal protein S18 acetylase RimI-like enzyme